MESNALGWQPGNYSKFWGRSLQDGVQYRLGTLNPSQSVKIKFVFDNIIVNKKKMQKTNSISRKRNRKKGRKRNHKF